jgi:uncharacterized delta-60 repeat protein
MRMIRFKLGVYLPTFALMAASLHAQPGSLDTSFAPGTGIGPSQGFLIRVALANDGKIIICGRFYTYNGVSRTNVARLNPNGSLDLSFVPPVPSFADDFFKRTYFALPQPDGKVLMGGEFTGLSGQSRKGIARLNGDGSLDLGFNPNLAGGTMRTYQAVLQPDGKIIIDGSFTSIDGISTPNGHARLNPDGTRDASYTPGAAEDGGVLEMTLQPDRKILVGGTFNSFNGVSRQNFVRLLTNGVVDTSFNPGAIINDNINSPIVYSCAPTPDGKIFIGGRFQSVQGVPRINLARLNANGTLDMSFANPRLGGGGCCAGGLGQVLSLTVQPNGKVIVFGDFTTVGGVGRARIARFNSDGSLDSTFNPGTGSDGSEGRTVFQPDGKVVLGGTITSYNGTSRKGIVRINGDSSTNAFISVAPRDELAVVGANVTFSVLASSVLPLSYQWFKEAVVVPDATNVTLQLTNVQFADAGSYSVLVTNSVSATNTPPAILSVVPLYVSEHPHNVSVREGGNTILLVKAVSSVPVTYQWRFNGTNLLNQTIEALVVTNAQMANDGEYAAVVSNAYGSVTSATAQLRVLINPIVTQPPLSQTVVAGGSVTLSIGISGNPPPFLYQWRRASTILTNIVSNERSCFFTLNNVQTNQGGPDLPYRVIVTNAASPALLVNATFNLTVLPDTDGDGLPDAWEIAHGLDPANRADALLDSDGDGVSNLDEQRAGTNPTDALSYLKIDSITLDGATNAVALRFLAHSNTTYSVESRPAAESGPWHRVAEVTARATNRQETVTDPLPPAGSAPRFYRIATPSLP